MSDQSPKALAAIVEALAPLCKQHGIRRVRVGEVELEFGGGGVVDKAQVEQFQRAFERGMPTDEDLLNYSQADYVPSWDRVNTDVAPPPAQVKGRKG